MKSSSMANILSAIFLLLFSDYMVAEASAGESSKACQNDRVSPIIAVIKNLDDSDLKILQKGDGVVHVLWDEVPVTNLMCMNGRGRISFARSIDFQFKGGNFIAVTKAYGDESAAFVQVVFEPQKTTGDFFLRNIDGWKVRQRFLWDSRGAR